MNYWDDVASNKNYYFGDYNNQARLLLLKLIKDGEWLLDVGSGNGMTYDFLIKNKRQIFYKGIDYSEKMLQNCRERWPGISCFEKADVRDLKDWPGKYDPIKEYDTVYIRHCLENVEDWKDTIKQMFRLAKKRVIIDMRRPLVNSKSEAIRYDGDTFCWDMNYDELNVLCRNLTVNVSYLQQEIGDSNTIIVLGKKLDDVVFTLDDFHQGNNRLDLLLDLKKRFPNLKVSLFTIPSKCSVKWLKGLKEKYDWMEFAVHGWFHNVTDRPYDDGSFYPEECKNWTKEEAHKYLKMAEDMRVFVKGFKAPGWILNRETYEVLKERGYWIMDHANYKHLRPDDFTNYYETGHLWEVNGHIQETPFNGLETIINHKLPFLPKSDFYFASEMIGTEKDRQRLKFLIDG